ncbi:carbohydrate kinase family protein [Ahrensia kielensis]|uniref:carbohydrate kinase family protein n=1 Tax=Ahrensia kielensis TaxID=76980 RepID=UPI00036C044C|nr:carbohydrate kinase family protein [Ahrensia kielensis]
MTPEVVRLLAVGGAHIDRTARMIAPHIAGASNPVTFSEHIGGGAFNVLRGAHMRGVGSAAMMSVRGGDSVGAAVEQAIEDAGIDDFSGTFVDRATPTYTAILDTDGELITALADMALYDVGFDRQVRRIEGRSRIAAAKALLVDANLSATALIKTAELSEQPLYAMGISPAKVTRLKPIAQRISVLFINRRELTALTGSNDANALTSLGFRRAVITDGANSLLTLEDGALCTHIIPASASIVDVTGAGDSLAGGTIAALITQRANTLKDAVRFGIACAQMTLQANGPVCQALANEEEFNAVHARVLAAQ